MASVVPRPRFRSDRPARKSPSVGSSSVTLRALPSRIRYIACDQKADRPPSPIARPRRHHLGDCTCSETCSGRSPFAPACARAHPRIGSAASALPRITSYSRASTRGGSIRRPRSTCPRGSGRRRRRARWSWRTASTVATIRGSSIGSTLKGTPSQRRLPSTRSSAAPRMKRPSRTNRSSSRDTQTIGLVSPRRLLKQQRDRLETRDRGA